MDNILDLNAELRKVPGSHGHKDIGEISFLMPEMDYYFWTTKYPDLMSKDAQISRKAWIKFLGSDEGFPYRTHRNFGKKGRYNDHVIVR